METYWWILLFAVLIALFARPIDRLFVRLIPDCRKRYWLFSGIGVLMLAVACGFILYALNHPQMSFPWSNTVSYCIYGFYILCTVCLLSAPLWKKKRR